jgi:toxin ParE1/3/4
LKVVLSHRARLDLLAQTQWLAELSPSAAIQAAGTVRFALKTLAEFPLAGRAVNNLERHWPIRYGRDGFVAVYRVEPDRVVIGRLFHSRQDR